MLTVAEALKLKPFRSARVVAGQGGLDNVIRWVHIVDIPDVLELTFRGGELLLTTAYALKDAADLQQRLIPALVEKGLAGMVVAIGRYFHRIPPDMVAAADELNFPIIEVPWELPFIEVTEALFQRLISEQYELLRRSFRIHQTLTQVALKGEGMDSLARTLAQLLGRSVIIEDADLTMLAYATLGPVDEARQQSIGEGRSTPEVLTELEQQGLFTALRADPRPRRVPPLPHLGMTMERIIAPIMVGDDIYGYVWVIAGDHPLEELDFRAIEHAATVGALILVREQAVREAEQRLQGDFLDALLSNTGQGDALLVQRAAQLGYDLSRPHQVLMIGSDDEASPRSLNAVDHLLGRVLSRREETALVTRRQERLVVVLEGDETAGKALAQELREAASHLSSSFSIGIGRSYSSLADLHRSYAEAEEALHLGRLTAGPGHVTAFSDLGFLHWLYHLPPECRRENPYLDKVQALAAHDAERHSELLPTLEAYLDLGGNAQRTATHLFIHRNTLLYRLKRIEEICQVDLNDPLTRLNLHLALKQFRLLRE